MQLQLISMGQTDSGETQPSLALYRLAWEIILEQLQEFLSYEIFINDPANIVELHAMRIAAKKLRYSIEAFSALYPDELKPYLTAVRQTQDTLGSMHDSYVWNQYLIKFMEKEKQRTIDFYGSARGIRALQPGITFLSQHQVNNYQDQYKAFITDWQSWQADNLWQELVNAIKTPLF
jgi:CHAD domain-containing protein